MKWIFFFAMQVFPFFFALIAFGLVWEHLFLWPLGVVLAGMAVMFEVLAVDALRGSL